mmetsp:Transcript_27641/g.61728  ORF Transcript_27641/g.61728 Transcript_27641/m.61728 type:complete len:274 (+) Transcript_27641:32-853(+)
MAVNHSGLSGCCLRASTRSTQGQGGVNCPQGVSIHPAAALFISSGVFVCRFFDGSSDRPFKHRGWCGIMAFQSLNHFSAFFSFKKNLSQAIGRGRGSCGVWRSSEFLVGLERGPLHGLEAGHLHGVQGRQFGAVLELGLHVQRLAVEGGDFAAHFEAFLGLALDPWRPPQGEADLDRGALEAHSVHRPHARPEGRGVDKHQLEKPAAVLGLDEAVKGLRGPALLHQAWRAPHVQGPGGGQERGARVRHSLASHVVQVRLNDEERVHFPVVSTL